VLSEEARARYRPGLLFMVTDSIEAAAEIEAKRCDALESEFGADCEFVLRAIIHGWSIDRARQERASQTSPPDRSAND
jgi:hypothetical protein